jgi:hypothetical protein
MDLVGGVFDRGFIDKTEEIPPKMSCCFEHFESNLETLVLLHTMLQLVSLHHSKMHLG